MIMTAALDDADCVRYEFTRNTTPPCSSNSQLNRQSGQKWNTHDAVRPYGTLASLQVDQLLTPASSRDWFPSLVRLFACLVSFFFPKRFHYRTSRVPHNGNHMAIPNNIHPEMECKWVIAERGPSARHVPFGRSIFRFATFDSKPNKNHHLHRYQHGCVLSLPGGVRFHQPDSIRGRSQNLRKRSKWKPCSFALGINFSTFE